MEVPRDFENAIVELCSEGVLRYALISQGDNDNEVPEVFLGSFIAPRLHERFHCAIHVERSYIRMAAELKIDSLNLIDELGGLRADVVMYQDGFPSAIIELKIFDECTRESSITLDSLKIRKLTGHIAVSTVHGYVGAMICETTRHSLNIRTRILEAEVGRELVLGAVHTSQDKLWRWRFGCARL